MIEKLKNIKGDKVIWVVVILLSIFSILAVYSSTLNISFVRQGGNTEYYLIKHFIILIFGFLLIYLCNRIKYIYYSRLSQVAIIISVILLLFTLITGTEKNEASRWLTLPFFHLSFQSSDFAKLALILYLARLLHKKQDSIQDFKGVLPIFLPIVVICGLILPENLSTAAILFVTCIVLMFIGRINLRYLLSIAGIGLAALVIGIFVIMQSPDKGRLGTWKARIVTYVNGGDAKSNYQIEQSKIAIATGGIFGKSPGKSVQRNFLPHPYSDFIFAIFIEEYGLVGGVILILLYLILLFRGTRLYVKHPGSFGALMAIGVSFSLVFQAMINMAVAVGLLPVTGQPLPLLSMGGTSIWFTSIAIGMMLSVSSEIDKKPKTETTNEF